MFIPRNHQKNALKLSLEHLNDPAVSRFQMIAACGTGKTAVESWIVERYSADCNLIVVPSRALVVQMADDFTALKIKGFQILLVFSDNQNIKGDELRIDARDIKYLSTTKHEMIAAWLKVNEGKKKLLISTYKSVHQVGRAIKKLKTKVDLAICDEAHNTAYASEGFFKHILLDNVIPCKKRIFFTATPRILKFKQEIQDKEIIKDMSNAKIYGKIAWHYSYKQALADNVIVPIKLVVFGIKAGSSEQVAMAQKYGMINYLSGCIDKAYKDLGIDKLIVYKTWIANCEKLKLALDYKKSGYTTSVVIGAQPNSIRQRKIKEFKEEDKAMLLNHRCLSEGVNLPHIDGVFVCDPIKNPILINQIIGRAYRKYKKKKQGYAIIPFIIDEKMTSREELIASSSFKLVNQTITTLKNQGVYFETDVHLAFTKHNRREPYALEKIVDFMNVDFRLRDLLTTEIIDYQRDQWYEYVDDLIAYVKKNGVFPIARTRLGGWWQRQKMLIKRGKMSKEKLDHLRESGLFNVVTKYDKEWKEKALRLVAYVNKNHKYPIQDTSLGRWLNRQKIEYKKGTLKKSRIAFLRKHNINIEKMFRNELWYKFADELIKYVKENNAYPLFRTKIGRWYHRQRIIFYQNNLSAERVQYLIKNGIVFKEIKSVATCEIM